MNVVWLLLLDSTMQGERGREERGDREGEKEEKGTMKRRGKEKVDRREGKT